MGPPGVCSPDDGWVVGSRCSRCVLAYWPFTSTRLYLPFEFPSRLAEAGKRHVFPHCRAWPGGMRSQIDTRPDRFASSQTVSHRKLQRGAREVVVGRLVADATNVRWSRSRCREDGTSGAKRWRARPIPWCDYFTFTFACAFFRSAQYFFIRTDTAWRAAADIRRPLRRAVLIVRRTARRFDRSANSGNVRSMAMISARSCFNRTSAPVRASSRKRSTLNPLTCLATYPPVGDSEEDCKPCFDSRSALGCCGELCILELVPKPPVGTVLGCLRADC